ncbi:hypothetical protein [Solihabitans fulvus]|uniref:hypothetical protein n=1 Tax=Solihabitans fulvus TaxID=1892852 RepID=UPI001661E639|nr:hypothetical protein [Solihabitans fulvus]
MGHKQLSGHRFQGYDNNGLAGIVQAFHTSNASHKFAEAAFALKQLAMGLAETDQVLRQQLKQLGIDWQGASGDAAATTVKASSDYGDQAHEHGTNTSTTVMDQSSNYGHTSNTLPSASTLQGPTSENLGDKVMGFFGHTTDHAKEVQQTNVARQQTIDSLTNYTDQSQQSLNSYQPMPQPPGFDLHTSTSSTSSGITAPSSFDSSGVGTQPGTGTNSPSFGVSGNQGANGLVGTPAPIGTGGVPGVPGSPGTPGARLPGGGNSTGVMPVGEGQLPQGTFTGGTPRPTPSNFGLGVGLGTMGGLGLGAMAAGAKGGQVVRGGPGGAAGGSSKGGLFEEEAASAKKGSASSGIIGEEERLAGRAGGKAGVAGKGGSSMMQPAAAGKGKKDEDAEHVRKYGVDDSDVFDDERLVVQSVLGDDKKDQ